MKKMLTRLAALLLLLGTQTTLADRDDGWKNRGGGWDRHDNGRGNAWGRRNRDRDRWDRDRWDNDGDRVSINLNIGTVPDWRYRDIYRARSGRGIPYTTTWGAPSNVWRYGGGDTVIVHQNTYINEAPRTTRIVRRAGRNSTTMFRDVMGRCYERSIDGRGVETRVEVSISHCDF